MEVSAALHYQTKPDAVDGSTAAKGKRSNGRLNFIDAQMESNDEFTSPRLQQLIETNFGLILILIQ